ncbi:MAG TPA: heavy metal translocating P-type ATPase [Rhodocyclaceae bacterium]|nr:heavy metal translocating P-type ATPase [Rhodocyclaceae bacterium]
MHRATSAPNPLSYRPSHSSTTAPAPRAVDHGQGCCGDAHGGGDHDHGPGQTRHDHRDTPGQPPAGPANACAGGCCGATASVSAHTGTLPPAPGEVQTRIRIMQMDCPTEESLLRTGLGDVAGVGGLGFNLMQRVLTVNHAPARLDAVLEAIRALGFTPEPLHDTDEQAAPEEAHTRWWPLALAGVAALGAEVAHWLDTPGWVPAVLAICAVLACGTTTFRKGWIAVRNRNFNINALMSIAVTGAMLIGQWPEAAMVMVLFTIAELIEARSLDRARNAVRGLMQLAPEEATLLQADGTWLTVAARDVAVGARVRVRPGERIALDGVVASGRSAVNQSPITGESLPVDKTEGDPVFAGTINETGSFEYTVSARAGDSTLARIIHAIEAAQGARAPTQRFVDAFARIYTPAVLAVAVAVAVLPPLWGDGEWLAWIYKALVLLVIACPCALVISTPVTIVSGLAAAARQGILVKGGIHLERGRKLAWIAFDKTGTLTHGQPAQTDFAVLSDLDTHAARQLAASLAARSDHPVSRAVAEAARVDGVTLAEVTDFEALPGRGVRGVIGGRVWLLGNHRLIHERGLCDEALEARLDTLEAHGKTVVVLAGEDGAHALFAVADTVRPGSRAAIADLHALGIRTLMLSGDNSQTARAIAAQVGIDEAHGDLLPDDKLALIEKRISAATPIGMVGDGINDAPALARADIGFAMGAAGTGTAIETADVALMDDDLRKLPQFIRLSRHTHRLLVQNIVIALGIKAVFLVLTLLGLGTMWMAVFADVGASLIVVANGLRLLQTAPANPQPR